jgi:hypothetical protein
MSSTPFGDISNAQIGGLVLALESLTDGELAVDLLIACGERAIAPLEELLLQGKARTIAVPRCRAVRALEDCERVERCLRISRNSICRVTLWCCSQRTLFAVQSRTN